MASEGPRETTSPGTTPAGTPGTPGAPGTPGTPARPATGATSVSASTQSATGEPPTTSSTVPPATPVTTPPPPPATATAGGVDTGTAAPAVSGASGGSAGEQGTSPLSTVTARASAAATTAREKLEQSPLAGALHRGSGEGARHASGRQVPPPMGPPEPSLGQLVASASRDMSALVRSEIALAKIEVKDDVKRGAIGGGMFAAAGVVAVLAVILLSVALAFGINAIFGWNGADDGGALLWPGFVIVAVLYLVVTAVLALLGKKQLAKVKPPQRTIDSTKETVSVLKGSASGSR